MFDLKKHLNVPNVLSAYRLFSFPVVMYFALAGHEKVFVVLLVINLITDALDGIIARAFKLQSEFGAKLDAYADITMYITAIVGVVIFKLADLEPHMTIFLVFVIVYFIPKVISYYKFKEFPSLHLYSSKIGGYMQGFFFFVWFVFDFYAIFFYVIMIWGILSLLEQVAVVILASEAKTDVKGLYWFLKEGYGS